MGVIVIMNENNEIKNKHEIDAKQIFDIVIKYWWISVISVLLVTGAALGYSSFTDKTIYTSSATFLMNGDTGLSSYQQILAGQYQSNDYPYILTSRNTLEDAASRINETGSLPNNDYTASKLSEMVKCSSQEDSRIFTISVTSSDPDEAYVVANEISEVFKLRAQELTKTEVGYVETPGDPVPSSTGNYSRNALVGAALGLVIGVAISILLGLRSDALDSESWLLDRYGDAAPLLASIPNSAPNGGRGYYKYKYKYKSNYGYASHTKKGNKSK